MIFQSASSVRINVSLGDDDLQVIKAALGGDYVMNHPEQEGLIDGIISICDMGTMMFSALDKLGIEKERLVTGRQ